MSSHSQLQKIISVFMIFILLIQLSSCVSTKIISSSDLPLPKSSKYHYIIHSKESSYRLDTTVISNGILSGKINLTEDYSIGQKIKVYLSSDSVMKINTNGILSIPLNGIAKVEVTKVAAGKTILLVTGCIFVILIIVGIGAMRDFNFLPNGI